MQKRCWYTSIYIIYVKTKIWYLKISSALTILTRSHCKLCSVIRFPAPRKHTASLLMFRETIAVSLTFSYGTGTKSQHFFKAKTTFTECNHSTSETIRWRLQHFYRYAPFATKQYIFILLCFDTVYLAFTRIQCKVLPTEALNYNHELNAKDRIRFKLRSLRTLSRINHFIIERIAVFLLTIKFTLFFA